MRDGEIDSERLASRPRGFNSSLLGGSYAPFGNCEPEHRTADLGRFKRGFAAVDLRCSLISRVLQYCNHAIDYGVDR